MSLKQWADNGWLRPHRSSRKEIEDLLSIVDRDIESARVEQLSPDWRFGIAYNAALKLCTILVHASGYRPERARHHYLTIQALPLILGDGHKADARYLDTCRIKRNKVEYETAGGATELDAEELAAFAVGLRKDGVAWLKKKHPELC